MKIKIEIPDGEYCNDGSAVCPLWDYGGIGYPFCKRFKKRPTPERHQFPYMSSIKLRECQENREPNGLLE